MERDKFEKALELDYALNDAGKAKKRAQETLELIIRAQDTYPGLNTNNLIATRLVDLAPNTGAASHTMADIPLSYPEVLSAIRGYANSRIKDLEAHIESLTQQFKDL